MYAATTHEMLLFFNHIFHSTYLHPQEGQKAQPSLCLWFPHMVQNCAAGVGAAGAQPPSTNDPRPTLRACLWRLGVGRSCTLSNMPTEVLATEDTIAVDTPASFSRVTAVFFMECAPSLDKSKSSNGCGLPSMRADVLDCAWWSAVLRNLCKYARSDTAMLLIRPLGSRPGNIGADPWRVCPRGGH